MRRRSFRPSLRKLALFLMTSLLLCTATLIVVRHNRYHGNPTTRRLDDTQLAEDDPRLINPHPYRFTMTNQGTCEHGGRDVFIVIIVHTTHGHVSQRQAIRATWGKESNIPRVVVKIFFALGTTDAQDLQAAVEKENALYGDIIQENFIDSYKNLTLKTVMTLKWFLKFCPKATYLFKTDDDTYVNVSSLVKTLQMMKQKSRLVLGSIHHSSPVRDVESKWYLSTYDFLRESLPRFPSGGAGYVISGDVVRSLYEVSLHTKLLYLEDVFIGLCLEKLGISPVDSTKFDCCTEYFKYDPCKHKDLVAIHMISAEEMYFISKAREKEVDCEIENKVVLAFEDLWHFMQ